MNSVTSTGRSTLAVLTFFTLLAGDFWRNLIGWYGFAALCLAIVITLVVLITRDKGWRQLTPRRVPLGLTAFLALAIISITWSFYPGATLLGLVAQAGPVIAAIFFATSMSWPRILTALGRATRWILGLSLLFEFVVAVFVRRPIIPFWVDYGSGKLPDAFFWSQAHLFTGDPIQGIVGNRNLLAFVAVIALVCLFLEFTSRSLGRARSYSWFAVAVATLALTRSTTAIAVLVVVAAAAGILILMRRSNARQRRVVLVSSAAGIAAIAVLVGAFSSQILRLFGKSSDLTGRLDIWNAVTGLAQQRPAFGWGWVSYWVPWVEPFTHLAERKGVTYLQAHNAWLDVWLQLGIVGLVLFIGAVVGACWRSWWFAVDEQLDARGTAVPFVPVTLLPALILTLLVAQSFVESRMLVEGGFALLALMALKTRLDVGATGIDLTVPDGGPVESDAPVRLRRVGLAR
ncbi:O-antigen ligase family protein [Agreia sp. PsM10]|uniref:O-antigen ligase family protein n=1 Tax=Agreia sp. PsM10 TaxID=3030533 RepID=UPI00263BB1D7|nr:O-antigen ligase family protein [Agreia sp. PsM10]MDN4639312.1 O-antigen ligase family protein [Agreia sp. PsM10]